MIKVNSTTKNEYVNSKNTQYLRASDGTIYSDKFKSANNLDDIVLASTNYINEDLKHSRKDSFKEFARGDVLIRVGSNDYSAKVIVGFTGNQMVLYDIVDFTPTSLEIKNEDTTYRRSKEQSNSRNVASSKYSISNSAENVNSENFQNDNKAIKTLSERVSGDELLNAEDLIDEVRTVGGEVEIIEAELSSMTGSQNSEDTVNNSASNNKIPQSDTVVNTNSTQENKKYSISETSTTDYSEAVYELNRQLNEGEIDRIIPIFNNNCAICTVFIEKIYLRKLKNTKLSIEFSFVHC